MELLNNSLKKDSETNPFEMPIEDISFDEIIQGVILTGKIRSGTIRCGKTVFVNDKSYTVIKIDMISSQGRRAVAGATVGLHLSTFDASAFKRGDIVKDWRVKKNSFVCDVCKKELAIKYRQKANTCVECAAAGRSAFEPATTELADFYREVRERSKRTIFTSGIPVEGNFYEQVEIWIRNGKYHYTASSVYDKYAGAGDSSRVPENCISNGNVNEKKLLQYIAEKYPYMVMLRKSLGLMTS